MELISAGLQRPWFVVDFPCDATHPTDPGCKGSSVRCVQQRKLPGKGFARQGQPDIRPSNNGCRVELARDPLFAWRKLHV